ncbi:hypothetical protein HYH03_008269 [Edaphochlamys debaryana]|uniref:Uncharacterized protein n=1 Tax=Edaphochlamys debaryana TaxID=47281 RepID=A0A836BY50_9CHLO|nr:hypothetical protein HYH03_008269 [Edaphochlamys debaryana]|eukprot:KAG2493451.1 hypothetical protein HYH03_008269 [Edaphochlamys debaryana]
MSKLRLASRTRAGPGLSEKEQIELAIRLSLQQEQAQQQVAHKDLLTKFDSAASAQPRQPGSAQPQVQAPVESLSGEELAIPCDPVDRAEDGGLAAQHRAPKAGAQPAEPTGRQAAETLSKRKAATRRTYRDMSDSEDEGGHAGDADDYAPEPECSEEEGSDSDFEADESEDERPKKKARKSQAAAKKAPAAKKAAAGGRGKAAGAAAPKPAAAAKEPKPAAAQAATVKAAAATSGKGKTSGAAAKAAPPAPEPPPVNASMAAEAEDGEGQELAPKGADPDAGDTDAAAGVGPTGDGQQAMSKGLVGAKPAGPPKAKPAGIPKAVPAGIPKPKPAAPAKAVAPEPSGALARAASKPFSLPKPSVGPGGAAGKVMPQVPKPLGLSNRTPSAGAPSSSAPFKPPVLPGASGANGTSVGSKSTPAAAAGGGPSVKPLGSGGGGIKFPPGSGAYMVSGLRRPSKKPAA